MELSKVLKQLIILYAGTKELMMTADDKFETSTEFGQKIALYRGLRFNCRISEDYTL